MNKIKESTKLAMKNVQDQAKHYADHKRFFCEFEVSNKVFINVGINRSRLKLGKSKELSPRCFGPFENLKRIDS